MENIRCADRQEWLEVRRSGIGASDAPAILGVSRFKGPLSLYHEKIGDEPPNREESEALYWGKALEPAIAQRYADETRRRLVHPGEFTIQKNGIHQATLDRLVPVQEGIDREGVLELKAAHYSQLEGWEDDQTPLEYMVQVQHQMMVRNTEWGSIAVLIAGHLFMRRDIKRDEEFIRLLRHEEEQFWSRVLSRNPPKADGSAATKELLKRLYPRDKGTRIALGDEYLTDAYDLTEARRLKKQAEELERAANNRLAQAIGDNSYANFSDGTELTYLTVERAGYTVQPTEYRVMRVKAPKSALKKK